MKKEFYRPGSQKKYINFKDYVWQVFHSNDNDAKEDLIKLYGLMVIDKILDDEKEKRVKVL